MALTDQDKIECKQLAGEIIKEVLVEHIQTCPHHQAYLVTRARIVGIITGAILASGVTSGTLAAVIMKFFA